jgi:hypothetical protein
MRTLLPLYPLHGIVNFKLSIQFYMSHHYFLKGNLYL